MTERTWLHLGDQDAQDAQDEQEDEAHDHLVRRDPPADLPEHWRRHTRDTNSQPQAAEQVASSERQQGARAQGVGRGEEEEEEEERPVLARRMPWSTSAMSWFVAFICSLCALRARLLSTPMASAEATSFFDLPTLLPPTRVT